MDTAVPVASGKLLKQVHISQLQVGGFGKMIIESQEKTVLIEIIIHHLFPEIDMQFVVGNEGKGPGLEFSGRKRKHGQEIIPQPEIEIITVGQGIVVQDFAAVSFFQSYPLHEAERGVLAMPLQLLPGPVLRPGDIPVIIAREKIDKSVACGEFGIVVQIIGEAKAEHGNREIGEQIFPGTQMNIGPAAPFFTEAGLVEITSPNL